MKARGPHEALNIGNAKQDAPLTKVERQTINRLKERLNKKIDTTLQRDRNAVEVVLVYPVSKLRRKMRETLTKDYCRAGWKNVTFSRAGIADIGEENAGSDIPAKIILDL